MFLNYNVKGTGTLTPLIKGTPYLIIYKVLLKRFKNYDVVIFCATIISPQQGKRLEVLEMGNLHLPIIIEMDEDEYYIVSCPLFRGCHSYGKTIDEALKNIREVIDMCLEETKVEELNKFVGFRELEVSQNA